MPELKTSFKPAEVDASPGADLAVGTFDSSDGEPPMAVVYMHDGKTVLCNAVFELEDVRHLRDFLSDWLDSNGQADAAFRARVAGREGVTFPGDTKP